MGAGKSRSAIVGLGVSTLVRKYDLTADHYAAQAVDLAVADAGLEPAQIDGLLINRSPVASDQELSLTFQTRMGYQNLSLMAEINGEGSSAIQMVQYATLAIAAGLATRVACVFADTPLKPNMTGSDAFSMALPIMDVEGWERVSGLYGPVGAFALFAGYHMGLHGITEEQLSAVAISNRRWALMNPDARLRKPLTAESYFKSPVVATPFRVFDCAYPVNGAAAVIVSAVDTAVAARRPAYVAGMGQGHSSDAFRSIEKGEMSGAGMAAKTAYAMAGVGPKDITSRQIYDAFSHATLYALEEYGFCERGGSGELVAAGELAPGGTLPTNTGGGHLSCYYLQGMTPLLEAVRQVRGGLGERQMP
ncbi:MAG: thiolase family protein, partial [Desulfobacterales bacterium]|nr:thiolase family protein [Desulfobacterales bacterium]